MQDITEEELIKYLRLREMTNIALAFHWTPSEVENEDIETVKSMVTIADAINHVSYENMRRESQLNGIPQAAKEKIIKTDKLRQLYGADKV